MRVKEGDGGVEGGIALLSTYLLYVVLLTSVFAHRSRLGAAEVSVPTESTVRSVPHWQ